MPDEEIQINNPSSKKSILDNFMSMDRFLKIQLITIIIIVVVTPILIWFYISNNPQTNIDSTSNPPQEVEYNPLEDED